MTYFTYFYDHIFMNLTTILTLNQRDRILNEHTPFLSLCYIIFPKQSNCQCWKHLLNVHVITRSRTDLFSNTNITYYVNSFAKLTLIHTQYNTCTMVFCSSHEEWKICFCDPVRIIKCYVFFLFHDFIIFINNSCLQPLEVGEDNSDFEPKKLRKIRIH